MHRPRCDMAVLPNIYRSFASNRRGSTMLDARYSMPDKQKTEAFLVSSSIQEPASPALAGLALAPKCVTETWHKC